MSNIIYCLSVYNVKADYHQAPFQASNLKEAVAQFREVLSKDEQPLSKNKDDYALELVSSMETTQKNGKETFKIENICSILAYGKDISYHKTSSYYKEIQLPLGGETPEISNAELYKNNLKLRETPENCGARPTEKF